MNATKVIIDCDPGIDDALALMLALRSPELEILGITVVSGNVPAKQGAENAKKSCTGWIGWTFPYILEKNCHLLFLMWMRWTPMEQTVLANLITRKSQMEPYTKMAWNLLPARCKRLP